MFDELRKPVKEKERLKSKAYATIMTNYGGLNLELHGDRAPKTVYNFVMLAKQGFYDDTIFHRLIPGFMVSWQIPTEGHELRSSCKVVIPLGQVEEGNRSGVNLSEMSSPRRAHTSTTRGVFW